MRWPLYACLVGLFNLKVSDECANIFEKKDEAASLDRMSQPQTIQDLPTEVAS